VYKTCLRKVFKIFWNSSFDLPSSSGRLIPVFLISHFISLHLFCCICLLDQVWVFELVIALISWLSSFDFYWHFSFLWLLGSNVLYWSEIRDWLKVKNLVFLKLILVSKGTIFIHIKRLFGLFCVFAIIEGFGWGFHWLFDIDGLIFFFFVIKVLLGKWTFCFLSSFLFLLLLQNFENQHCRILELWSLKRTLRKVSFIHWLFVLTFRRKLEIAYSVCIGIGNRLLSPIIRIHWTKRLYFFISLHWLGQSHTSLSFTSVICEYITAIKTLRDNKIELVTLF